MERQDRLHKAMTQIMAVTCVRFEPAQNSTVAFVAITDAQKMGCFARIGYTGGRQVLNLGTTCQTVSLLSPQPADTHR
jgi:urease beta subunit